MILRIEGLPANFKRQTVINIHLDWLQRTYFKRHLVKTNHILIFLIAVLAFLHVVELVKFLEFSDYFKPVPLIIIVTPTYQRLTRMADLTRMANTLMHVNDIHWILVEDGNEIDEKVNELLKRSRIPFSYLAETTAPGYPKKGWYQRNVALKHVRENIKNFVGTRSGVLYFGDDDNSYDTRLFDDCIRKVQRLGMWAVGLVGGSVVESPMIINGRVVGFNVGWYPERKFAVDMAGFAINLEEFTRSKALFGTHCHGEQHSGENCFLEDMGFKRVDIEPYGYDKKEILVWHTRSKEAEYAVDRFQSFDDLVELVRGDRYVIL